MSFRHRRPRVGAAILAAAALALAGCGDNTDSSGSGGGKTPADGDAAAMETATVWALNGGDQTAFEASFERWNAAHPDAQIKPEIFANEAYKEKIRTAVGAGQAPTLIWNWSGGTLNSYVANNEVVEIGAQTAALRGKLIPSVVANGEVNSGVYAVPMSSMQPVILYYNKALFEKVGAQPPATWDELLTVVGQFVDAGITPFALGGQSKWPELMWIAYLTDRIGGPEAFDKVVAGEADAWSDPAFKEALTLIRQLIDAGGFGKSFSSVSTDANADIALVHTDKAAMILQGSWCAQNFKTDNPEWVAAGNLGFLGFPEVTGGKGDPANITGNPANYWSVAASATAGAQATATAYLAETLFDDAYIADVIAGGGIPPVTGLESQLAAQEDAEYLTFAYSMAVNAPHFQLSWDQALPADQAQELLTNLDLVFLGQSTPDDFVAAMNATLK
ncbi:MAG: extracellular solute-binding protein [Bifidobacteriaceae bacterium]|nr:extracellular solute-binding protein [Bifidobacteriaceae bacterium]